MDGIDITNRKFSSNRRCQNLISHLTASAIVLLTVDFSDFAKKRNTTIPKARQITLLLHKLFKFVVPEKWGLQYKVCSLLFKETINSLDSQD